MALKLGNTIQIPDDYNLIPKNIIVGQNGVGKTNLLKVFYKELTKAGYTVIVFDKLHNYKGLAPNFIDKNNLEKIAPHDIVKEILTYNESTVIDFLGIHGKKIRANIIDQFIQAYMDLKPKLANSQKYAFLIDEVQNFIPQNGAKSEELMEFYTESRNYKTIFVVGGTRFASVHKEIVENANNIFIMRTKFKNSIEVIKSLLKYELDKEGLRQTINKIQNLDVGEVILWSSQGA